MIMAVADYVEDEGPLPPDLALALNCEQWGALPEDGGIRNQYAGELLRMQAAMNVYRAMLAFNRAVKDHAHAEWMENNPKAAQLVRDVSNMRHKRKKGWANG